MQDDFKKPLATPPNGQPLGNQPTTPQPVEPPHVTSTDPLLLQPLTLPNEADETDAKTGEGEKQPSGWRDFLAFIGILAVAGILAAVMFTFVFRSYSVDGPSMESTLQNEDKLIVWKLPRTIADITGHPYIPNRGDVIIFHKDDLAACGQIGGRDIIKRVIALPGERVVISNGAYTVYNKQHPQGFQPDNTLPYNKDHHIPYTTGDLDLTVPANDVFVSGDNRPNSCDSRAFGPIPASSIKGKLIIRLLPANKIKLF